ncbi:putative dNA-damage-inducible protein J, partial [Vibrio parahaemolyticus V-223/04]
MPRVPNHS